MSKIIGNGQKPSDEPAEPARPVGDHAESGKTVELRSAKIVGNGQKPADTPADVRADGGTIVGNGLSV